MQLTIFITGKNPVRQQPIPQEKIPPIIVELPHPKNPIIFSIPETRKKVLAVCNSVGIIFIFSDLIYHGYGITNKLLTERNF